MPRPVIGVPQPFGPGRWVRFAVRVGLAAGWVSRRSGVGAGGIIGGRVASALAPSALSRLAAGRTVVLVSGTNGKTTTSHLLAAALRTTTAAVAHNASGANMADGALAALADAPGAPVAVLEVDELHLAAVAAAVDPAMVVLLNLSRDQLDRGSEVRAVAAALNAALAAHPDTTVVANADDPMVVWAVRGCPHVVWVATGGRFTGDVAGCPACGHALYRSRTGHDPSWWCGCGLARPAAHWVSHAAGAAAGAELIRLELGLPGRFNRGNAVTALAAAAALGIDPHAAATAMARLREVAGRYAVVRHGDHELRLLLAKNPAGWAETLTVLDDDTRPLLIVVNAREADGRDTSWLWDVAFEQLCGHRVVAAGERCADLGVRLSYAEVEHATVADPLSGLALLPAGRVDVIANYTAFHQLRRRLRGFRSPTVAGPP